MTYVPLQDKSFLVQWKTKVILSSRVRYRYISCFVCFSYWKFLEEIKRIFPGNDSKLQCVHRQNVRWNETRVRRETKQAAQCVERRNEKEIVNQGDQCKYVSKRKKNKTNTTRNWNIFLFFFIVVVVVQQ